MKSSFPKRDERHSKKKWAYDTNAMFIDCVYENNCSHMNEYMHIYLYIFLNSSFAKHYLRHWQCNLDRWIGAYRVLEKSPSYTVVDCIVKPIIVFLMRIYVWFKSCIHCCVCTISLLSRGEISTANDWPSSFHCSLPNPINAER